MRDQILALRSEGKSYSKIAAALGVSRNVVAGHIWRASHGRPPRPPSYRAICREKGIWPTCSHPRTSENTYFCKNHPDRCKMCHKRSVRIFVRKKRGWHPALLDVPA